MTPVTNKTSEKKFIDVKRDGETVGKYRRVPGGVEFMYRGSRQRNMVSSKTEAVNAILGNATRVDRQGS